MWLPRVIWKIFKSRIGRTQRVFAQRMFELGFLFGDFTLILEKPLHHATGLVCKHAAFYIGLVVQRHVGK